VPLNFPFRAHALEYFLQWVAKTFMLHTTHKSWIYDLIDIVMRFSLHYERKEGKTHNTRTHTHTSLIYTNSHHWALSEFIIHGIFFSPIIYAFPFLLLNLKAEHYLNTKVKSIWLMLWAHALIEKGNRTESKKKVWRKNLKVLLGYSSFCNFSIRAFPFNVLAAA
jgi:hypothetical protein